MHSSSCARSGRSYKTPIYPALCGLHVGSHLQYRCTLLRSEWDSGLIPAELAATGFPLKPMEVSYGFCSFPRACFVFPADRGVAPHLCLFNTCICKHGSTLAFSFFKAAL